MHRGIVEGTPREQQQRTCRTSIIVVLSLRYGTNMRPVFWGDNLVWRMYFNSSGWATDPAPARVFNCVACARGCPFFLHVSCNTVVSAVVPRHRHPPRRRLRITMVFVLASLGRLRRDVNCCRYCKWPQVLSTTAGTIPPPSTCCSGSTL